MRVVGLDGCPGGWVAVWWGEDVQELEHIASGDLAAFFNRPFDLAMIDIPIGLPSSGKRDCDLEARACLAPHRSRVFTGARRGLWQYPSRAAATEAYWAAGDDGVSCQLWCLGPKITQVDALMTPRRQERVCETHPELTFRRLWGAPLPSKKTSEGETLRRDIVRAAGLIRIDEWLATKRRLRACRDDILDACACAIAARDKAFRIPRHPPKDAKKLRMEIWY